MVKIYFVARLTPCVIFSQFQANRKRGYIVNHVETTFTEADIPQEIAYLLPCETIDFHCYKHKVRQRSNEETSDSDTDAASSSSGGSSSFHITSEEEEEQKNKPEEVAKSAVEDEVVPIFSRRNRKLTTKAAEALEDAKGDRRRRNLSSRSQSDAHKQFPRRFSEIECDASPHQSSADAVIDEHIAMIEEDEEKPMENSDDNIEAEEEKMMNSLVDESVAAFIKSMETEDENIIAEKLPTVRRPRVKQQTPNKIIEGKRRSKISVRFVRFTFKIFTIHFIRTLIYAMTFLTLDTTQR